MLRCRTAKVLLLIVLAFSFSCSRRDQASQQSLPPSVLVSTPPFKTQEPNSYKAVRAITFASSDGNEPTVTTVAIVRDGELRREEETSRGKRVVYLELSGERFLLLPDDKIYATADGPTANTPAAAISEAPYGPYLHTAPILSTYENLGTETVNGNTATKYKVVVNNSNASAVSQSETFIWVDEALGMPVKSITRSAAGTRTMELSQITLNVDRTLFEIPKDYQKVDMPQLRQRIR